MQAKVQPRNDFLETILVAKRAELNQARQRIPEPELRRRAEARRPGRGFGRVLEQPGRYGANIIAEVKRASPSKGPIRPDLDPALLARSYEAGGAAALSVLTDAGFFAGSPADLEAARAAVGLPVLRKDFILSTYQIYETAALGADALLFIVRALSAEFLRDALALSRELGLDALVEVHSEPELETALHCGAHLVGINSRDLATFQTDLDTVMRLRRLLGNRAVAVAESGIGGRADILRLVDAGVHNFLIGESLVRSPNPETALRKLLGRLPSTGEAAAEGGEPGET